MKRLAPKLFAILVAALLWAAVNLEQSGLESLEARIRYRNMPAEMELNPDLADALTVVVRGPHRRIEQLRRNGLALEIDCDRMQAADERTITVTAATLSLPRGLELVKAVPSQIRVALEPTASREIDIVPRFSGDREPGYMLESYWVDPPRLRVTGPAARLALLDAVATDPIDLSGLVGAHSFQTTAYLADPYLRFESEPLVVVDIRMQRR